MTSEHYYSPAEEQAVLPGCVRQILATSVPAGRVYIALAFRVDQIRGIVSASYEQIAVDGGMSRRQAGEGVARLIAMGYLELVAKGHQRVPNVYRLRVMPPRQSSSADIRAVTALASSADFRTAEHESPGPAVRKSAPFLGDQQTQPPTVGEDQFRGEDLEERSIPEDDRRQTGEITAVRKALHRRTGRFVTPEHAQLIVDQLLDNRAGIGNREAYLVGAIKHDEKPERFLPTPQPPRFTRDMIA